jgi:hypothetical protein
VVEDICEQVWEAHRAVQKAYEELSADSPLWDTAAPDGDKVLTEDVIRDNMTEYMELPALVAV